jgi:tetratricopeptide (TPR) repeat protein
MPESRQALVGLGEALLGLNEKDAAPKSFKRVLAIMPDIEARGLYKRIGTIAFRLKEYDIAVKAFETAATFIQTDPELFYVQSLVYVAQWKFPEALASINRALSLKPTFIEAQKDKEKIIAWVKAAEEKEMQSATAT